MVKKLSVPKNEKRSHRAQYPTPGFYFFSTLLNIPSLGVIVYLLLNHSTAVTLWLLGGLGVLGLGISIYSITIRPKESNKKTRKILVASTAAYGFILLAAQGLTIILNPGAITG